MMMKNNENNDDKNDDKNSKNQLSGFRVILIKYCDKKIYKNWKKFLMMSFCILNFLKLQYLFINGKTKNNNLIKYNIELDKIIPLIPKSVNKRIKTEIDRFTMEKKTIIKVFSLSLLITVKTEYTIPKPLVKIEGNTIKTVIKKI